MANLEHQPDVEAEDDEDETGYGVTAETGADGARPAGKRPDREPAHDRSPSSTPPTSPTCWSSSTTTTGENFIEVDAARTSKPRPSTYLDEDVRDEVMEMLGPKEVAQAFTELETDDAVDILEDLDEEAKQEILAAVPAEDRAILEEGLTYPEDSAGRLMQRDLVAVPSYWTVGETIDFLRASGDLPDDFYDLFIVDPKHTPIGRGAAVPGHAQQARGQADGHHGDGASVDPRATWTRKRSPTCSGNMPWCRRRWWTRPTGWWA